MAPVKLVTASPDSVLGSELCAKCPYSPAGCCVAPPRYDWSDLGRVVAHGHLDWLVAGLAAGRFTRIEHGLALTRVKGRVLPTREAPRLAKCVFHDGATGCTIDPTQRPATCNFYLCESALDEGAKSGQHADVAEARRVHDALVEQFVSWDQRLDERVRRQGDDIALVELLAQLGERFTELRSGRE